jgi:hypothetical protein
MIKINVDIAWDTFVEIIGEDAFNLLKDGDDVTQVFKDDLTRPLRAVILEKEGPGGGNPHVQFTFMNEDHAWEWYSEDYGGDVEEFELSMA